MAKKNKKMQAILYIALAVLLLFCLTKMTYGFYLVVRFLAFAGFGYLAYLQYKGKQTDRMVLFIILALLFQPFFPLALGRVIWNIVDVIVAVYLIYLLVSTKKK